MLSPRPLRPSYTAWRLFARRRELARRLIHFLKLTSAYALHRRLRISRGVLRAYLVISIIEALQLPQRSISLLGTSVSFPDVFWMRFLIEELLLGRQYAVWPPLRPDPLIVDAGANIGLATIYFKCLFPRSHVISIEPHPATARYLRANLIAADFPDVDIVERALAGSSGGRWLAGDGVVAALSDQPGEDAVPVETVSLHSLIPGSQDIDILKLDIEGAELEVLRSIAADLSQIDQIIAEIHVWDPNPDPLPEVLKLLHSGGHRYEILQWTPVPEGAICIVRSWRSAAGVPIGAPRCL